MIESDPPKAGLNWDEWNGTLAGYWWMLEQQREERDSAESETKGGE